MLQVLVLKELALNAPTFFFQQVQPFFENISNAVRDPKVNSNNYVPVCSLRYTVPIQFIPTSMVLMFTDT